MTNFDSDARIRKISVLGAVCLCAFVASGYRQTTIPNNVMQQLYMNDTSDMMAVSVERLPHVAMHVVHGSGWSRFQQQRFAVVKNLHVPWVPLLFVGQDDEASLFRKEFPSNKYSTTRLLTTPTSNLAQHVVCVLAEWPRLLQATLKPTREDGSNVESMPPRTILLRHVIHANAVLRLKMIRRLLYKRLPALQDLPIVHGYVPVSFAQPDMKWTSTLENHLVEKNVFSDVHEALFHTECGGRLRATMAVVDKAEQVEQEL
jgi:hypothetical protein